MTVLRMAAALAGPFLLVSACGGGGDDDSHDATPTVSVESSPRPGDCGHVGEINSPNEIANSLLALEDLPEGFTIAPADPRGIESIGNEVFQENIDPSTYSGGAWLCFRDRHRARRRRGPTRRVSRRCLYLMKQSAALLVANPFTGEPTLVEPVEVEGLGDESKAFYFEIENGETDASGYIYQFRAGQMVAYIGNVGSGEEVTLEQTRSWLR